MLRFPLRRAAGAAALLALCATARAARAVSTLSPDQLPPAGEYTPLPAPAVEDGPPVLIRISPEQSGLSYHLRPDDDCDAEPAVCQGSCTLELAPGRYSLEVFDHGKRAGSQVVRVKKSVTWHVHAQNRTLKSVGLAMGIGGSVLGFVGLNLATLSLMSSMCEGSDCGSDTDQRRAAVGWLMVVGGAGLSIPGWILFARNRAPIDSIEKAPEKQSWTHRLRVAVAPTRGGAHLSAGWTF